MPKEKPKKPRIDYTRKIRADRRKAFLDAAAKRMGFTNWGEFEQAIRECIEEPVTDRGVNARLVNALSMIVARIPDGDPVAAPADADMVRELYPYQGKNELSEKTMGRIRAGIEKFGAFDEAGRLAARPKASEVFTDQVSEP
jgi:hypothetical protein